MRNSLVVVCALAAACGSKSSKQPDQGSGSSGSATATGSGSGTGSGSAVAVGSGSGSGSGSGTATGSAPGSAVAGTIDKAGIDSTVKPGDDFFAYANGAWSKTAEIPADRASWGATQILTDMVSKQNKELIDNAVANAKPGTEERKVADYFTAYMDEAGIEAKGMKPLEPALAEIDKIADAKQLIAALGATLRTDVDVLNASNTGTANLIGFWIAQDLDDPSRYVPFILQGGLMMPDREYYTGSAPRMKDIRTKYLAHVAAQLKNAGIAEPDAKAKRIVDLETKIAQVHSSREETSDVHKGDNHWKRSDFASKAPGLDWDALFTAAGMDKQQDFVVWHPKAITGIAALVKSQPLGTWKEWLAFHKIESMNSVLPKAFNLEAFDFFAKTLAGVQKQRDRWKRAIDQTTNAMGDAVGKLYVAKHFPPAAKAKAQEMVKNELEAFSHRIDKLDWMAESTKAKAKAKLAALKVGVGYPDTWVDYSGLEVAKDDAYGNHERADLFDTKRKLARLGQPVDRGEWVMVPHLVNAVNLPAMNALNFPAAILQPPNFDVSWPDQMNYGAMGATIGHEISHSFDDQGALFDDTGRLKNWWTPEDFAHFKASGKKLIDQFSLYKPFPDLAVNGAQTISENIADVAGLSVAFDAYRAASAGKDTKTASGFTPDQEFFLAYAQSWREKDREEAMRQRIVLDTHAPDEYRADTVRNLDAWYDAFKIEPTDKLYLKQQSRVKVW